MKTIYKYRLDVLSEQHVLMHKFAEIICVQVVRGSPCLYAIVDTTQPANDKRTIHTYGTGHRMFELDNTTEDRYVGTFQLHEGALVFHVFEEQPVKAVS